MITNELKEFPRPVVLIGIHKYEVFKILGEFKVSYRIALEDEKPFTMGPGFQPERVNLYIKDGIVFDYKFY